MGLDITAYKNVELIDTLSGAEEFEAKYDWRKPYDFTYQNPDYPERMPPIQPNGVYRYQDKMGFRAGSYGGYNQWREMLCEMVHGVSPRILWSNPEAYKGKAFFELINFSDCEGIIGTEVSKKLLQDFIAYQEQSDLIDDEWFKEKYNDWRKAFEYAADNGYIDFH